MIAAAPVELAQPLALWGLAAALPIVLFHLYLRRRRMVLVPFSPLLLESMAAVRSEARFKRLREGASLLLRLLALACVVLALAGLRPADASPPALDLVLVLDGDVTMAAREADGALRLRHAVDDAHAFVRAVPTRPGQPDRLAARVGLVLAAGAPRLVAAPSNDRIELERRLEAVVLPAALRGDLTAAWDTALDALRGAPGRIVVLTARPFEPGPTPAGVEVLVHGVGRVRADQGIVDLAVTRVPAASAYAVHASVRNDDDAPRTREVVVRVGDAEVARGSVVLEPGATEELTWQVPAPEADAWLDVGLEGEDAFPANDAVAARLAPTPRPSVLVVHGGRVRPYTAAIVEALADTGWIDPARGGFVAVADLAQAEAADVIVVDGVGLPPAALRPGAYVFLAPLSGALPFELGAEVEEPLVWRKAPGHPLVGDLDLRRAFVVRGRTVAGDGLVPLAYAEGRPVIAEGERDGVRYVVLGLDPEGSAMPFQAELPRLVRTAVLRLARAHAAPLAPLYRVGEALRPAAPLPGGPEARIAWSGPARDARLAEVGRGTAAGRLAPDGSTWRVPPGASGRTRITTGGAGATAWTGWTALLEVDPQRTIVPVRPPGAVPAPAAAKPAVARVWRTALLALAGLFLLLDLALVAQARRRR